MSRWTVTVEKLDEDTAHKYKRPDTVGMEGVVVRYHDGRFVRVDAVRDEIPPAISMEQAAQTIAEGYGARYAGIVE
ncbi:hypothetical protein ACQPYK_25355 [Streptosporangium sp. CA-135522]|uniref:hypothetical protein n=1 Tax=Streptosporangium sp. CA-135522 TaxID=3240072 RepID=UPI003D8E6E90